jgi:L-fuconolactonase
MTHRSTEIVDAQVHVLDPAWPVTSTDHPYGAGAGAPPKPPNDAVTGEDMVRAMDAAGVDAAVLVNPTHYGWDNGYALHVAATYPDRFRVVGLVDHRAPDVDAQVARWAASPAAVGLRILVVSDVLRDQLRAGEHDGLLTAARDHDVPVCVFSFPRYLPEVAATLRARPDVRFVLDHFGVGVPVPGVAEVELEGDVAEVMRLAECPNVSVKLSGGPALAAEPFPFDDLWPTIERYLVRFGPERCMWGSDWTRVRNASYAEALEYLAGSDHLGNDARDAILGGTARTVFGWPSPAAAA